MTPLSAHRLVASVVIIQLLALYVNGGSSVIVTTVYKICKKRTFTGNTIGTTSTLSEIDCARRCKSNDNCSSAIFTHGSSLNNCHMTTYTDNWDTCDSYSEDLASTIMFPVKVCLNGGQWEMNNTCACPDGFTGHVCQDAVSSTTTIEPTTAPVTSATTTTAPISCDGNYIYDSVSGVCYKYVTANQVYADAKLDCESVPGGHLLSDLSLPLLNRLISEIQASPLLSSTAAFMVDGKGDNSDNQWNRWDGQHLVYPPDVWANSQPNSGNGQSFCIFMASGQTYKLNDLVCTKVAFHICQLDV